VGGFTLPNCPRLVVLPFFDKIYHVPVAGRVFQMAASYIELPQDKRIKRIEGTANDCFKLFVPFQGDFHRTVIDKKHGGLLSKMKRIRFRMKDLHAFHLVGVHAD
jgi:hypothetical protein